MTDLIMNLVDSYGFAENRQDDGQALYARNLVEVKIAELNAERDALELRIGAMIVERSDAFFKVIQERDAYAAAADTMAAAHKVERDALKDAAKLALVALNGVVDFDPDARAQWSVSGGSIEAHECNAAITALKAVL